MALPVCLATPQTRLSDCRAAGVSRMTRQTPTLVSKRSAGKRGTVNTVPNIMALANMASITTSRHMMSQLPTEEVVLLIIDITVQNVDVNIFPTELLNT